VRHDHLRPAARAQQAQQGLHALRVGLEHVEAEAVEAQVGAALGDAQVVRGVVAAAGVPDHDPLRRHAATDEDPLLPSRAGPRRCAW
jgi:hypothetical protein